MIYKLLKILFMEPCKGWVLIEPLEETKTTTSGIIVPTEQEELKRGTIISLPSNSSESFEMGDKIFYKPLKRIEVTYNDKKHFLVEEKDIIAVL